MYTKHNSDFDDKSLQIDPLTRKAKKDDKALPQDLIIYLQQMEMRFNQQIQQVNSRMDNF